MSSIPSRSQVYEDFSYDNQVYRTQDNPIPGPSWPRRPPRIKTPAKKQSTPSPSDPAPVVYIDLDEMTGNTSTVSTPGSSNHQEHGDTNRTNFVANTIFYSPFDDSKPKTGSTSSSPVTPATPDSNTGSTWSTGFIPPQTRPRPAPPNHLNLNRQIPEMSRFTPEDDFSLNPISVNEFPHPPPAYSEVDRPRHISGPAMDTVINIPPPSTQVIFTGNHQPVVPVNPHRKFLFCTRCGARVHTLVVKQPGQCTHFIACMMSLVCLIPCLYCVYFKDCCKYKNHYCPNCNHLIGYEGLCQKQVVAK